MEGLGLNNNFSLLMMLIITIILVSVNTLEILNLKNLWDKGMAGNLIYFENCMKYPFILKSFYVFYSLSATISIFFLTFALVVNPDYFIRKFSKTYIEFNCFVFGPGMAIPGILAFLNFNKFIFTCELRYNIYMIFNISNAFSIILCFLIGLLIWVAKALFETMNLYSESMTRHPNGSWLIRTIFWWTVLKFGRSNNLIPNNNVNNNNENLNYPQLNNSRDFHHDENSIIVNETFHRLENSSDSVRLINNSNINTRVRQNQSFSPLESNVNEIGHLSNENLSQNDLIKEEQKIQIDENFVKKKNLEYLNRLENKKFHSLNTENLMSQDEIKIIGNNENQYNHNVNEHNIDVDISQNHNINNNSVLNLSNNRSELYDLDEIKLNH